MQLERLKIGAIGLVREAEDGRIQQIGLTQEQSDMLQMFLMVISKDSPLVEMGESYELMLKKQQT